MYSKMELEQPSTARRGSVRRTPTCAVQQSADHVQSRLDELDNAGAHQVLVLLHESLTILPSPTASEAQRFATPFFT